MEVQQVILVDKQDQPIGTMDKLEVHQKGLLHRAFSIFIFNKNGEMLLQQRADQKYHSPGLWTNACCSHPQPGEITQNAASARLQQEMGFTTPIEKIFDFTYEAQFDNGLTEHEFDHVYAGVYDGPISFHPDEVKAAKYMDMQQLTLSLEQQPEQYTAWFKIAFPRVNSWWAAQQRRIV